MPTWPSPRSEQLGTPNPPRNPIHAFATACQVARSPVRIRPTRSAPGSFYFQASNRSVALPVAGYDYNSDWTPLLAGLSPARMAASLAAPDPDVQLSRIRLPPRMSDGEAPIRPRMKNVGLRKPIVGKLLHSIPWDIALVAAAAESPPPAPDD